ncbi:hypothetical protein HRbin01_00346 [archaeon HR01]|nr:hypothetical protein HRbin01_00346 [archaeon HR01]
MDWIAIGRRIVYALLGMVALIVVLALGALTPLDSETYETLLRQAESLASIAAMSPLNILANNLLASLFMIIPAIGPVLSAYIVYVTGQVISAISISQNISPVILLLVPFVTVYGIIEMLAYGLAVSESVVFTYAIIKRRARIELRRLPIVILAVAGLLLVAALIEYFLISLLTR